MEVFSQHTAFDSQIASCSSWKQDYGRPYLFFMEAFTSRNITLKNGETTHYYEGGPENGVPMIFIHGWPDLAQSWIFLLLHFSTQFRVIAPDMRGYGLSSIPTDKRSYALNVLAPELADFANQLGAKKAIWVAHDWGVGVVNALAAHYPELFYGYVLLSLPYRGLELGLDHLVTFVNRDLYPADQYPWGPFEYIRYYELYPEESARVLDGGPQDKIVKFLYQKANPSTYGAISPTATYLRDGGWFGGHPENLPDLPLNSTVLDEGLFQTMVKSHEDHGFTGPISYYLNNDVNAEYAKSEKNGGYLKFPVLYFDAKYDVVCSPSLHPKFAENQAKFVKDLTYETIEGAHWLQLETPKELISGMEKWLKAKFRFTLEQRRPRGL